MEHFLIDDVLTSVGGVGMAKCLEFFWDQKLNFHEIFTHAMTKILMTLRLSSFLTKITQLHSYLNESYNQLKHEGTEDGIINKKII
ncbi:CLUMA_CG010543, isoform A [Clunio marinus]|uniref:CLUMA_CG010543, isoform A n=1 Tax=Clunio marinus TaxID=568069 RepID=A0A1J1IBM8_9DIPT|nr:CLUMA_CG010543, isoform A [Clunio marinus]